MWIVFYCSNLIRSNIFLLFWLFIEMKACDFVLLWFQPVRTVITAPTVNRNVSVNGGNAIASEDVCAQTDMEAAVRNQVKKTPNISFQRKCCVFLGDVWAESFSACDFSDMKPVIVSSLRDIELNSGAPYTVNCSASGQPAPLHGEITLVKPDKTTVYVSLISITSPMHLICSSHCVLHETPLLLFFSGSGHADRKWPNDIHIQGGENHSVGRWPLVVSSENQKLSRGERVHCKCQRWDSSWRSVSIFLAAKVPNNHNIQEPKCYMAMKLAVSIVEIINSKYLTWHP